jgi:hypothetical protein
MKFSDATQRGVYVRACQGNHSMFPLLPEALAQTALAALHVHNERGAVGGVNPDPLRIRARWASHAECLRTPERQALAAIAQADRPNCKCRLCRLREAAKRMQRLSLGTADPWKWGDVWAHLPEAAFPSRHTPISQWEWADEGINS